jgi:hypothetical protein
MGGTRVERTRERNGQRKMLPILSPAQLSKRVSEGADLLALCSLIRIAGCGPFSPPHLLTSSHSHARILSPSHSRVLAPTPPLTLSPSHPLTLSPSHPLTLSPSHPLTLSLYTGYLMRPYAVTMPSPFHSRGLPNLYPDLDSLNIEFSSVVGKALVKAWAKEGLETEQVLIHSPRLLRSSLLRVTT